MTTQRSPLLLALATCLALWGVALSPSPQAAGQAPSPTPTPTLPAWTPQGAWRAVHAPERAPLWTRDVPRLYAVHAIVDGARGALAWAVGEDCAVAVLEDGRWQVDQAAAALCDGPRDYDLRDVYVRGPDDIWAVGAYEGGEGLERTRCVAVAPTDRNDVDHDEGCGTVWRLSGGMWRAFHFQDFGMNLPIPALNGLDMMRDPDSETWVGWAAGNNNENDSIASIILEFVADDARMGADGAWRRTGRSITPIDEDFHDVKIVSPGEAWIVGEGGNESLFRAPPDGSGIWAAQGISGNDHLYAVDLSDQLYGWSGGQRGRMNHYDGNCHDDDPATACWFDNQGRPVRHPSSPDTGLGNEIRAVKLQSRGIGWLAGRRFSRSSFLAYLQPDHDWLVVDVADDPSQDLFGLHFDDAGRGWAVGEQGTILEYVLPEPTASATPTASPTPMATSTAEATATLVLPATSTSEPTPPPSATASATATPSPASATRTPEPPRAFLPFAWQHGR
jgi:hypothetical protein